MNSFKRQLFKEPIKLSEALATNEFGQIVEYRARRIAQFMFLGYLKNQVFVKNLLKANPNIREVKTSDIVTHVNNKLLFSTHFNFRKIDNAAFANELKQFGFQNFDEKKSTKLLKDMTDLRAKWHSEIESDHLTANFLYKYNGKVDDVARLIKQGNWDQLQKEPHVKLKLYTALLEKKITSSELVFGEIIDSMSEQYQGGKVQFYSYEDKRGPYSIYEGNKTNVKSTVLYMTPEELNLFQKNLKTLPRNQQGYIKVDLSRKYEIAYFYMFLDDDEVWHRGTKSYELIHGRNYFFEAFPEYLKRVDDRKSCSKDKLVEQYSLLLNLKEKSDFSAAKALANFVLEQEADLKEFLLDEKYEPEDNLHFDNSFHLIMNFHSNEQIPLLAIQPYDSAQPNRSIVSRILPSPASFQLLTQILFGHESTAPIPIGGRFTLRAMKRVDMNSLGTQRLIEVNPPGIRPTKVAHDVSSLFAEIIVHDFYFHCYRSSTIPFKRFNVYLIDRLEQIMQTEMNKLICYLVDKPDGGLDIHMDTTPTKTKSLLEYTRDFFIPGWHNSYIRVHKTDLILAFFIDSKINKDKWDTLLNPITTSLIYDTFTFENKIFDFIFERLPNQSITFYIIAYHLIKYCFDNLELIEKHLEFLKKIEEKIGLNKIFKWMRNGTLVFNSNAKSIVYFEAHQLNHFIIPALLFGISHLDLPTSAPDLKSEDIVLNERRENHFDILFRFNALFLELNFSPERYRSIAKFVLEQLLLNFESLPNSLSLLSIQLLNEIDKILLKPSKPGFTEEQTKYMSSFTTSYKIQKCSAAIDEIKKIGVVKADQSIRELEAALSVNIALTTTELEIILAPFHALKLYEIAAERNCVFILKLLDDNNLGFNSFIADEKREILFNLAKTSNTSLLKTLIERDLSLIHADDNFGLKLLNTACQEGMEENIRLLTEMKMDLDKKLDDGFFPLEIAISTNKLHTIAILLKLGANPRLLPDHLLERQLQKYLIAQPNNKELLDLILEAALINSDDPTQLANYLKIYSASLKRKLLHHLFELPNELVTEQVKNLRDALLASLCINPAASRFFMNRKIAVGKEYKSKSSNDAIDLTIGNVASMR